MKSMCGILILKHPSSYKQERESVPKPADQKQSSGSNGSILTRCCILFVCLVFLSSVNLRAQNEKFKAMFIYNFIKYIEWPGSSNSSSFVITIVGDSPIKTELESIAGLKRVGSATLEIKKVSTIAEIGNSQVIYLPLSKKKLLPEVVTKSQGKPILVVSDEAQGEFGINFVEMDGKLKFQIAKSRIELHGLRVNSSLLSLGIPVD